MKPTALAPWLTIRDCARALRVSLDIYREIAAGHLVAARRVSAGGRPIVRVAPEDWQQYLDRYWRLSASRF